MTEARVIRSVQRLEEEIAALEREATPVQEEEEEEILPQEEEEEEVVQEVKVEQEVDPEETSFKKRYSDLRRHSQKLADDLREAQSAIADLKKQKSSAGLPSVEEAEAWALENPKAAAIIRALATNTTASQMGELSAIQEKLHRSEQEALIRKAHPDFEDIVEEDAFHTWAESQPQSVQKLVYSNAAEDVIWGIKQYKLETKTQPVNPQKEAAKAVSTKSNSAEVKTEGKGRFTESMIRDMSLSEYEKNEAAITQSQKDGTFVYDLSGAAR